MVSPQSWRRLLLPIAAQYDFRQRRNGLFSGFGAKSLSGPLEQLRKTGLRTFSHLLDIPTEMDIIPARPVVYAVAMYPQTRCPSLYKTCHGMVRRNWRGLPRTLKTWDKVLVLQSPATGGGDPPANLLTLYICGSVSWVCRHCGTWNRRRVRATDWEVRCTNNRCKRWTMLTAIQQDVPRGWRSRSRAHALIAVQR